MPVSEERKKHRREGSWERSSKRKQGREGIEEGKRMKGKEVNNKIMEVKRKKRRNKTGVVG